MQDGYVALQHANLAHARERESDHGRECARQSYRDQTHVLYPDANLGGKQPNRIANSGGTVIRSFVIGMQNGRTSEPPAPSRAARRRGGMREVPRKKRTAARQGMRAIANRAD